jgi:predicted nucleotidyltransferase
VRDYRDHDQLKTYDKMLFTVIGNVHPPDRVLAYLKYIPSQNGQNYKRILTRYTIQEIENTLQYLSIFAPQHMVYSERLGFDFSAPLRDNIKEHFKPEKCLQKILTSGGDILKETATELAVKLSDESDVPIENFGVTGSILLGIHNIKYSDIDLTIYGVESAHKVLKTLKTLTNERNGFLKGFSIKDIEKFYVERGVNSYTTYEEYSKIYSRLRTRGFFKEVFFSIHPVKREEEVNEQYSDRRYQRIGEAELEMTVIDMTDSIFYPAKYGVDDIKLIDGIKIKEIRELVSFDGLYSDIANTGERLRAKGIIEKVVTPQKQWFRLVVGTRGITSYIKLL